MISDHRLIQIGLPSRVAALYGPVIRVLIAAVLLVTTAIQFNVYRRVMADTITLRGMEDFGVFYDSAQRLARHVNPYEPTLRSGASNRSLAPNLNPPHFLLVTAPLGWLRPAPALIVWCTVSLISAAVAVLLILSALDVEPSVVSLVWTIAVLVAAAATGALLISLQSTWLLWAPMTWAWIAARRGRWTHAAVVIGVVVSVKPFLAILVALFALAGRWRPAVIAAGTACALVAIGAAALGPDVFVSWLDVLGSPTWARQIFNASIYGALARWFGGPAMPVWGVTPLVLAPAIVQPLWIAASLAILAASWAAVRRRPEPDEIFAIGGAASLLISPLGWIYYEFLLIGPALALATRERWWAGPPWRQVLGGVIFVTAVCSPGMLTAGQPAAWASVVVGSAYCWGLLALWVCVCVSDTSRSCRGPLSEPKQSLATM